MDRPKGMEGKKYATWDLDIPETAKKFLSAVKKGYEYSIFYKNTGIKDFISKIDTATKEVKTIKLGDDFFPEYPFLYSAFCVYQDQIISYIPALLALNVDKQYGLNRFTSISLKETDNPVLIFHHLK